MENGNPFVPVSLRWQWLTMATSHYQPWASYQIRKIAGCACAGNAGNVFPIHRLQRKPLVSDPDMHHGTCVTHVPWCMSGSLTCGGGKNVPGIPSACAPAISRIWQEAHEWKKTKNYGTYSGSIAIMGYAYVTDSTRKSYIRITYLAKWLNIYCLTQEGRDIFR